MFVGVPTKLNHGMLHVNKKWGSCFVMACSYTCMFWEKTWFHMRKRVSECVCVCDREGAPQLHA